MKCLICLLQQLIAPFTDCHFSYNGDTTETSTRQLFFTFCPCCFVTLFYKALIFISRLCKQLILSFNYSNVLNIMVSIYLIMARNNFNVVMQNYNCPITLIIKVKVKSYSHIITIILNIYISIPVMTVRHGLRPVVWQLSQ